MARTFASASIALKLERDMWEQEPYYTGISPEIKADILILSFFQDSGERGIVK